MGCEKEELITNSRLNWCDQWWGSLVAGWLVIDGGLSFVRPTMIAPLKLISFMAVFGFEWAIWIVIQESILPRLFDWSWFAINSIEGILNSNPETMNGQILQSIHSLSWLSIHQAGSLRTLRKVVSHRSHGELIVVLNWLWLYLNLCQC